MQIRALDTFPEDRVVQAVRGRGNSAIQGSD
jgi:hypothetical protein